MDLILLGGVWVNDKNGDGVTVAGSYTREGSQEQYFAAAYFEKTEEGTYTALITGNELIAPHQTIFQKEEVEPINPNKLIRKVFEIVGRFLAGDAKNPD